MRKYSLIVILLLIFFGNTTLYAADSLVDSASRDIAYQVAEAMPDDIHLRLLAIADIKGDDGSLHRNLMTAIKEKTNYTIIERKELDKILDEQGVQIGDLVDSDTRVQFGRIRGVEGILFGEVLEKKEGFMSLTMRVHLQLDNVESGEVKFSKDFEAFATTPIRNTFIIIAIIILIALYISYRISRRSVRVKEKRIGEDKVVREDGTNEVDKSLKNLSGAQDMLLEMKEDKHASRIREATNDLQLLKQKIEQAATGDPAMDTKKEIKQALKLDESMMGNIRSLTGSSDKIYKNVSKKDIKDLEDDVRDLRREIKDALNKLEGRAVR